MVAFLAAIAIEYGLYHRFLRDALAARDLTNLRPALKRWVKFTVAWQLVVVAGCVLYLVALASRHGRSVAWVAPPLGAAFGSALPLQFVAMAIVRSTRG